MLSRAPNSSHAELKSRRAIRLAIELTALVAGLILVIAATAIVVGVQGG